MHNVTGTQWQFSTARFTVRLELARDRGYRYDGDDEKGETQRALDNGDYIAFDSRVVVELDGEEIASDSLGGSVYGRTDFSEFWTAHRASSAEYRNTLAQKAQRRVICHYFPSMVAQAIHEARRELAKRQELPRLRKAA